MSSTPPKSPAANAPRQRQQAGLACDECRRRKLRCDRGQPSCGVCQDSGVTCVTTTTRQPRGPKRGHIRALQSRIVALEHRLSVDRPSPEIIGEDGFPEFPGFRDNLDNFATQVRQPFPEFLHHDTVNTYEREAANSDSSNCSVGDIMTSHPTTSLPLSMIDLSPVNCISDMMRSELYVYLPSASFIGMTNHFCDFSDHLYFDRVHCFFPILSKRHYFARARRPTTNKVDAFQCLQHTMWTLAASTSSQFQYIQDDLYTCTRLMIDNLEAESLQSDFIQIELVQACALMAVNELTRVGYRRAWMSAGKCFSFVMLMKLHNVDGQDSIATMLRQELSFAEIEERRRVFWMAYTLDRMISVLDQLPLTFDHHVILTHLPCSEKDFQSDRPVLTEFMSDIYADRHTDIPSTFTESIRLVTICGQSLSHRQQGTVEHTRGWVSLDFWDRQRQLDVRLAHTLTGMPLEDPFSLVFEEPMAHFTVLTAQTAVLMLYNASQTAPWGVQDHITSSDSERGAAAAAQQMVTISKALIELSHFKVHPYTPMLLYLCCDFLSSNNQLDPTFELQLALQNVLRRLGHVNQIAQDCVNRLNMAT
ncbi:citrinin biosynthesis transcriptional activator [Pyrenophora seminiperda CCB06]|uniref:Citrinin biosynthesis transcriptional activator n=1 Tax=Pyrenophora seminiperda CCB06 TaxID=1302712 RepID=A0A3M7LW14_9PLEO|nr:citrinin biosynthesis transcriptional activator [Pyrenophora seminiperda CCB06]